MGSQTLEMRTRRPREDDADARAEASNKRAADLGLVARERPPQNWDTRLGVSMEGAERDVRANPRPEPDVQSLPFRNLKGG